MCWSTWFDFPTRWVQYFDLQLLVEAPVGVPSSQRSNTLPLQIEWYGSDDGATWRTVYRGNVTRPIRCRADGSCYPVLAMRTSTVSYSTYFARVAITPGTDPMVVSRTIGWDTDVVIRQRNPDFATFELGFRVFFMLMTLAITAWYMAATGCDWGCCPKAYQVHGCVCLNRLCCRSRGDAPLFITPMGFHGQLRVNWLYMLLGSLVLYNQPLLWANYFAPYTTYKENPRANGLPFFNVACQLLFVALVSAYWLVEMGLLAAANENIVVRNRRRGRNRTLTPSSLSVPTVTPAASSSTESRAPGGAPPPPGGSSTETVVDSAPKKETTMFAFLLPKYLAVVTYWLIAAAMYGVIYGRMAADPLYDWVSEGTAMADRAGAGQVDVAATLVGITAILAIMYMLYFIWLTSRAVCSCRTMPPGERFLFAFHVLCVLATAFGLAGSAVYSADVTSPADFTFFTALYNVYVWTLAWLYSPQVVTIPGMASVALAYGQLTEVVSAGGGGGGTSSSGDGSMGAGKAAISASAVSAAAFTGTSSDSGMREAGTGAVSPAAAAAAAAGGGGDLGAVAEGDVSLAIAGDSAAPAKTPVKSALAFAAASMKTPGSSARDVKRAATVSLAPPPTASAAAGMEARAEEADLVQATASTAAETVQNSSSGGWLEDTPKKAVFPPMPAVGSAGAVDGRHGAPGGQGQTESHAWEDIEAPVFQINEVSQERTVVATMASLPAAAADHAPGATHSNQAVTAAEFDGFDDDFLQSAPSTATAAVALTSTAAPSATVDGAVQVQAAPSGWDGAMSSSANPFDSEEQEEAVPADADTALQQTLGAANDRASTAQPQAVASFADEMFAEMAHPAPLAQPAPSAGAAADFDGFDTDFDMK